jgi:hypothetical protein
LQKAWDFQSAAKRTKRFGSRVISPSPFGCLHPHRDRLAWDKEIEEHFFSHGKHEKALEKMDPEIRAGNFKPLP